MLPDKLRFDFTHNGPISAEHLRRIEHIAIQKMEAKLTVYSKEVPLAQAKDIAGSAPIMDSTVLQVDFNRGRPSVNQHVYLLQNQAHSTYPLWASHRSTTILPTYVKYCIVKGPILLKAPPKRHP